MQLHHLRAFLGLAHDPNFRQAAARLCLSQPALSAHIAELERHLGVRLFDRDRTGTRLTDDGASLLPLARSALAAVTEVEVAARSSPRYRRRFTAGLMDYGIGELTWPLLGAFHAARPDLHLDVMRLGFADAIPALHAGEIDVLLAVGPFGEQDGAVTTVGATPLAVLLPARHPQAEAEVVDSAWVAEHLRIRPPDAMGATFGSFWAMQDAGAPPLDRMLRLDPKSELPELYKVVARGHVGPWPSGLPPVPGTTVRPLSGPRMAPLQLVVPHQHPHPDARLFCDIALRLAGADVASLS